MIRTVSDMLAQILNRELPILDSSDVVHAPTIGDMYEGLSGLVLSQAIPQGLGLRVVRGFVEGVHGDVSGQIDRMLVVGSGRAVPRTESYVWPAKDVIAVLEVKKTLTRSALGEAMDQLRTVREVERSFRRTEAGALTPRDEQPAYQAYAEMTGRTLPKTPDPASLSLFDQCLLPTLIEEATSIIRIVVGWHGFKREATLRKAVADYVTDQVGQPDSGPASLPQLIISGDFCVLKANGQPFSPSTDGDVWPFYGSVAVNPLLMLLEVIWTRLDRRFGLGNVWGADLTTEVLRGLLLGHAAEVDGQRGWEIGILAPSTKQLKASSVEEDWEPARLSLEGFVVLNRLCAGSSVVLSDPDLTAWLGEHGVPVEDLVNELLSTRLVARAPEGNLELITKVCQCAILPNGEYVAGDDTSGRMSRWLNRELRSASG